MADVQGILDQPERDPIEAISDLALADRAAAVAARCAATLLRMHYETDEKRLTEFWHYSERTDPHADLGRRCLRTSQS